MREPVEVGDRRGNPTGPTNLPKQESPVEAGDGEYRVQLPRDRVAIGEGSLIQRQGNLAGQRTLVSLTTGAVRVV